MTPRRISSKIWWGAAVLLVAVGAIATVAWRSRPAEVADKAGTHAAEAENALQVEPPQLVPGCKDTLRCSAQVMKSLGVSMVQAKPAGKHDRLQLAGSLFLDPNRLVHVHARFPGEVVTIGKATGEDRPLRMGDKVHAGQLLAVVWSKDVGEKKSDLVDAVSQLYLDRAQYKSLTSLGQDVVAKRQVREAERLVEADVIRVERIERTLRSWRLTEEEIDMVTAEAEKIHRVAEKDAHVHSAADLAVDKSWAEVEVRSPMDGVILEKNIVAGDIVDTTLDLFQVADLTVLGVMANVYEEDLPAIEGMSDDERTWLVELKSQPSAAAIPGKYSLISNIVDPNQHTAAVMGWLDNKDGRLRAGQFITARVELPAVASELVLPDTAVLQEGDRCVVFVGQPDGHDLQRRTVALANRGEDVVYINSNPTPEELAKGCLPLKPGEWVVEKGAVELDGALENALATAPLPTSTETAHP
jgi:cobalt-zinc-cadmium efflux system membrane fusion protein